jgi:hypothetical protein
MQATCISKVGSLWWETVQKVVSIFLLLVMVGFGTGLMQRLHMLQHEHEDAAEVAGNVQAARIPHSPIPTPHKHSEDHCQICAQFHAPIISHAYVAWLIDTGCWVRYVSMLAISQKSQDIPTCRACRGPPVPTSC